MARGVYPRKPLEQRLHEKIDMAGECWVWLSTTSPSGYGVFQAFGRQHRAHRFVYEMLVGPIPDDLTIDHLCCNKLCVNPDHLEPVTNAENIRRAGERVTHCRQGHEYTPENTYRHPQRGTRSCRTCRNTRSRNFGSR